MTNIFEKNLHNNKEREIEMRFPLGEKEIVGLMKGIDYSKSLLIMPSHEYTRIITTVCSHKQVKHIPIELWRKLSYACQYESDARKIIEEIENEQNR